MEKGPNHSHIAKVEGNILTSNDEVARCLKNKLEKEGAQKVAKLVNGVTPIQPNSSDIGHTLVNIMKEGNEEFEKKMGRPLTYSEMRELYG